MLIGTASSLWNTFSFLHPWLSLLKSSPFWRSQTAMLLTGSVTFFTATDQTLFVPWASSDQLRSILAHQTALILVPNHSVLIFLLQFTHSFLLPSPSWALSLQKRLLFRFCLTFVSFSYRYPTTFEMFRLSQDTHLCSMKWNKFQVSSDCQRRYFQRHQVQKFNLHTMGVQTEPLTTVPSKSTFKERQKSGNMLSEHQ